MPNTIGIQALADQYGLEYYDLNLMPDQVKIDWKKDTRDKGEPFESYRRPCRSVTGWALSSTEKIH